MTLAQIILFDAIQLRYRRDDTSIQVPLPWFPDSCRQHNSWVWCMAGAAVQHSLASTDVVINQATAYSRCQERR